MNNTEKYLCFLLLGIVLAVMALSSCGQMNGGQLCRRFADKTIFSLDEKNVGVGCPKGSEPIAPLDEPNPIDEPVLNPDIHQPTTPPSNPTPPTDEPVVTPPTDVPPAVPPPTDECGDKEGDHGNADNDNSQGNEHKNCNGMQQI